MALVGRHVRVTGRVQGVFYRAWAQGEARELGISGWIRNCPDGTVEAQLSGEEHDVERMIERMRRGPSNARVEQLDVEDIDPENSGRFHLRN
jgi:acylphosphatase